MVSTYSHNKLLGGIIMAKETMPKTNEVKTNSMKIGKLKVNVRSTFLSEKNLCEIMYTIASIRLKEKSV